LTCQPLATSPPPRSGTSQTRRRRRRQTLYQRTSARQAEVPTPGRDAAVAAAAVVAPAAAASAAAAAALLAPAPHLGRQRVHVRHERQRLRARAAYCHNCARPRRTAQARGTLRPHCGLAALLSSKRAPACQRLAENQSVGAHALLPRRPDRACSILRRIHCPGAPVQGAHRTSHFPAGFNERRKSGARSARPRPPARPQPACRRWARALG